MKEVNGIVDGTIRMINSNVIGEIIYNSGYFEVVQDISNQLNADNTMVYDVFVELDTIFGESDNKRFENIDISFDVDDESLTEIINIYMELAIEDIVTMVKEHLNVVNVTSSYSINQVDSGISALIYVYFGEYFLNMEENASKK